MAIPKTLEESIEIAAPVARVWKLVSTSEGLAGWFGTRPWQAARMAA
jgi:uncharacterized protein YndB with AHSA1/START domain